MNRPAIYVSASGLAIVRRMELSLEAARQRAVIAPDYSIAEPTATEVMEFSSQRKGGAMKLGGKPRYRIRHWLEKYEINRTRELKSLVWWPCSNDLGTDLYTDLVARPDGAAYFGAWIAILCIASTTKPRGLLVRENGEPHDAESLSRLTRMPVELLQDVFSILMDAGELEDINGKRPTIKRLIPQHGAVKPQEGAEKPHYIRGEEIRGEEKTHIPLCHYRDFFLRSNKNF